MKRNNYLFGSLLVFSIILLFNLVALAGSDDKSRLAISNDLENNAKEYLLRLSPEEGDNYDISFEIDIKASGMDMSMGMELFQKILSVDGDEIDSKMGFNKATMSISMMGETINYDSENPNENPIAAEMHKELESMFSADLRMTIDSRGEILKESGFDALESDFTDQMGLTTVTFPEKALKIGDSFHFHKEEKGESLDATYTLINVSDTKYTISITGRLVGKFSGALTGKMILFKECAFPKNVNLEIKGIVEGQEMDMNILMVSTKS